VYKDGSWQEMDIEELHQYMVRSVKKGDHVDKDGWTAQEVYQIVLSFAAILQNEVFDKWKTRLVLRGDV